MTSGPEAKTGRTPCSKCAGSGAARSATALVLLLGTAALLMTLGAFGLPSLLRADGFRAIHNTIWLFVAGALCLYLAFDVGWRGACSVCEGKGYTHTSPQQESPLPANE